MGERGGSIREVVVLDPGRDLILVRILEAPAWEEASDTGVTPTSNTAIVYMGGCVIALRAEKRKREEAARKGREAGAGGGQGRIGWKSGVTTGAVAAAGVSRKRRERERQRPMMGKGAGGGEARRRGGRDGRRTSGSASCGQVSRRSPHLSLTPWWDLLSSSQKKSCTSKFKNPLKALFIILLINTLIIIILIP